MSKIITAYPTAGMTDRTAVNIITAFYDYISGIKAVTDFFEIEKKTDTENEIKNAVLFKKGNSFISMRMSGGGALLFQSNYYGGSSATNGSTNTDSIQANDISIRYAAGINGTMAIWLDEYSKGICMIFNAFDNKCFLANASSNGSNSFYYSDTGGTVNKLPPNFNGDNIGKGGEYIAQPYYHLGINTGDIYTIDGGTSTIPWGEFSLNDAEFVRITYNFALRLK